MFRQHTKQEKCQRLYTTRCNIFKLKKTKDKKKKRKKKKLKRIQRKIKIPYL